MPRSVFSEAYASVLATLIDLRKSRGVSQAELARRLGRPQQFISYVEHGERRIDVVEFYAIVQALGCDPVAYFEAATEGFPKQLKI